MVWLIQKSGNRANKPLVSDGFGSGFSEFVHNVECPFAFSVLSTSSKLLPSDPLLTAFTHSGTVQCDWHSLTQVKSWCTSVVSHRGKAVQKSMSSTSY